MKNTQANTGTSCLKCGGLKIHLKWVGLLLNIAFAREGLTQVAGGTYKPQPQEKLATEVLKVQMKDEL